MKQVTRPVKAILALLTLLSVTYLVLLFQFRSAVPADLYRFALGISLTVDSVDVSFQLVHHDRRKPYAPLPAYDTMYSFDGTIYARNNVSLPLRVDSIIVIESLTGKPICGTILRFFYDPVERHLQLRGINPFKRFEANCSFSTSPDYKRLSLLAKEGYEGRRIRLLLYTTHGTYLCTPGRYLIGWPSYAET